MIISTLNLAKEQKQKKKCCHTAGLESPTHALRADADPSAQSASATYITLAQEHPYDRHIEIILHLSGKPSRTCASISLHWSNINNILSKITLTEPHSPLVILERGRLSFSQYEEQICSRRDFIRCTRKDSDPEKKVRASVNFPCFFFPHLHLCIYRCLVTAGGVCEEAVP